jgi:phosphonate transport system substrate-binding protein
VKYWFWLFVTCYLLCSSHAALAEADILNANARPLRLGMTPAMAYGQYSLMEQWRAYLEQQLNRPVALVFRNNQQDSLALLQQKKLDFAWISAPVYLKNRHKARLLVTPLYQGQPYDRAYLIVSASDYQTKHLQDLQGKLFAYMDADSSTGYLEPRYQLRNSGQDPEQFFKSSFFTRDHLKVVAAVAIGLADGGSLSGFAWETLALTRPDITSQTRIVSRSAELGLPPIVARQNLDEHDLSQMRHVLLNMSHDEAGKKLLSQLNLDGFTPANDRLYHRISLMMRRVERP